MVDEIENNLLARKDGTIKLLNRDNIDTLVEEHEFQLSQLAGELTQAIIGKKISAEYIITGSYYNLKNNSSLNIKIRIHHTGNINILLPAKAVTAGTHAFRAIRKVFSGKYVKTAVCCKKVRTITCLSTVHFMNTMCRVKCVQKKMKQY